jgi:uncharacterized protein (DUF1778 family)
MLAVMSGERSKDKKKVQMWVPEGDLAEIDEGATLDSRTRTSFMVKAALDRARRLKRDRSRVG